MRLCSYVSIEHVYSALFWCFLGKTVDLFKKFIAVYWVLKSARTFYDFSFLCIYQLLEPECKKAKPNLFFCHISKLQNSCSCNPTCWFIFGLKIVLSKEEEEEKRSFVNWFVYTFWKSLFSGQKVGPLRKAKWTYNPETFRLYVPIPLVSKYCPEQVALASFYI